MPTLKTLAAAISLKKGVKFCSLFPLGKHRGISENGVTKSLDSGWAMILGMIPHFDGYYAFPKSKAFCYAFSRKHVKKRGFPLPSTTSRVFPSFEGFQSFLIFRSSCCHACNLGKMYCSKGHISNSDSILLFILFLQAMFIEARIFLNMELQCAYMGTT